MDPGRSLRAPELDTRGGSGTGRQWARKRVDSLEDLVSCVGAFPKALRGMV